MKTTEELEKVCMEIYGALYKAAKPSADFDVLLKTGVTKQPGWYLKYHLAAKYQENIIKRITTKHRLNTYEKTRVRSEIMLGAAPTTAKSPKGRK